MLSTLTRLARRAVVSRRGVRYSCASDNALNASRATGVENDDDDARDRGGASTSSTTSGNGAGDSARHGAVGSRREYVRRMRAALRVNDFERVREEFEALARAHSSPGRAAWNVSVLAAARAREPETALNIVESMLAENVAPDVSTHVAMMTAFVRAGRYKDAFNWLKMHLYGVPGDGLEDEAADQKHDLSHVIGDMIDGDPRRVSRRSVNSLLFTTAMNGAAKAGDRAMVQEIETMMFEFDITPGANTLHCLMKLERVAGTSASVEAVWSRSKVKARALKAHQERVIAHAFLGKQKSATAAESRELATQALGEMYNRVGRRRSDEEMEKMSQNKNWKTPQTRWTGARGLEEYRRGLRDDEEISLVGAPEVLLATNAVMDSFAAVGDIASVTDWFIKMEELNVLPDVRTFNAVLRAEYQHARRDREAVDVEDTMARFQEILDEMEDRKLEPTRYTFTPLLLAHAEHNSLPGMAEVLKMMQERGLTLDTVMYNILIGACARAGDLEAALNARASMAASGVQAGPDTFVPLFVVCAKQAAELDLESDDDFGNGEDSIGPLLQLTRQALDRIEIDMLQSDVEHNTASFTSLLKARGSLGQSDLVLEMIKDPPDGVQLDDVAMGVGVLALAKREPTKALVLANSLNELTDSSSVWLLNCVLVAYTHLGQIKAASEHVQKFIANGGEPNVETYNTLFRCASLSGGFAEYGPIIMNDMSARKLDPDARTAQHLAAIIANTTGDDREMAESLLKKCPNCRAGAHSHLLDDDDLDFTMDFDEEDDDDDLIM